MVLFDITTELALERIRHLIENDSSLSERTMMSTKMIMNLVDLCLETYLQFDGKTYKQVQMGSLLSRLLPNAVMKQLEAKAFETVRPRLSVKYVNDTFVVLQKPKMGEFHTHLNTLVPKTDFTRKEEWEAPLSFLGVPIMGQSDGSVETTVYRKPTTNDRTVKYNSNHPKCHPKNLCACASYSIERAHIAAQQKYIENRKKQTLKLVQSKRIPLHSWVARN